ARPRIASYQVRAQLARAPGRAVLPRRDEHVRNRLRHLVGDVMRTMRTLDQRFHVVAGLAIATQPDVRRLTADPELATQLAEIHAASPACQCSSHSSTNLRRSLAGSVRFHGMPLRLRIPVA